MARRPRREILYDGCFAHIFSRALGKQFIFQTEEGFRFFKSLLSRTKAKFGYRIHHYCLMHTHFHLAVSISQLETFSCALKEIKQNYSRWAFQHLRLEGPLWWGRFRSQLVEDETYLGALGFYIETNPVKAGIVSDPEDWPYSSSRHYLLGEKDPLVDAYEAPLQEKAQQIFGEIDFERGGVIGSELFRLHIGEGVLQD